MAIDSVQWKQITDSGVKGWALSAGYPDMLVKLPNLTVRPDSDSIASHHNLTPGQQGIPDSHEAFRSIGLELRVIDRAVLQGCEKVCDLNVPQDLGAFDLVVDPGTSEHCFNIPQAWVNLASAVKVGGFISQALPLAMFNHGYWNPNPVAMFDFLEANGFKITRAVLRNGTETFDLMATARRRLVGVPDGAVTCILAQRVESVPLRYPQQKLPSI